MNNHFRLLFVPFLFVIFFTFSADFINAQQFPGSTDLSFGVGIGNGFQLSTSYGVNVVKRLSNGQYIIGGDFISYNGTLVGRIARLNSDGSLDTSFNLGGVGINNGFVSDIVELSDGKLLVSGQIGSYNGVATGGMIRLNSDGSFDSTFNTGLGFDQFMAGRWLGPRKILVLSSGKYLVVGMMLEYNGTDIYRIARLNSDGTLDNTFNHIDNTNTFIYDITEVYDVIEQSDGKLIFAGEFSMYDDNVVGNIIRTDSNGFYDNTFNIGTGANSIVRDLLQLSNGQIIVSGNFTAFNGTNAKSILRINANGTIDNTFAYTSNINGSVYKTIKLNDNRLLSIGSFTSINNVYRGNMMILNSDGTLDINFGSDSSAIGLTATQFSSHIYAIEEMNDGSLLMGGRFSTINGLSLNNIVKIKNIQTYAVANLLSNLDIVSEGIGSLKYGQSIGLINSNENVTLEYNGLPVSDFTLSFSNNHIDFTSVNAQIDFVSKKSYISGLTVANIPELSATHSLYVPKGNDMFGVYVCPNATSLEDVYVGCIGGYILNSGAPNLGEITISGTDYWIIDGLTGTGALGLSQYSTDMFITPNTDNSGNTQEVVFSYITNLGFVSGDEVQIIFEPTAGFTLSTACTIPTTDSNNDSTNDGIGTILGGNVYEYTFSDSIAPTTNLEFCVLVTSPLIDGSYSVNLSDDNGSYSTAIYYVGNDNDVFVLANVSPSLSFNIRTLEDDADSNICSFGSMTAEEVLGDFENGSISVEGWSTEGDSIWEIDNSDAATGFFSAKSAEVPIRDGVSLLHTTVELDSPATLNFSWKMNGEQDNDYLSFSLNDLSGWSWDEYITGNVDWTEVSYSLPAGTHTLTWQYYKYSELTYNDLGGWIDNVYLVHDTYDNYEPISSSSEIPNYDARANLSTECGYALAVGTNAQGGFQVQISSDGPLSSNSANIANIANNTAFVAGQEAYGIARIVPAINGRNPISASYTEELLPLGGFSGLINTAAAIPQLNTPFIGYNGGVEYVSGGSDLDVTKVIHGLVIGSGTPAGIYDQVVTYTVTANF